MGEYSFDDVLVQRRVTCNMETFATRLDDLGSETSCTSLFFPGCSFINYGMPLVQSVFELLEQSGEADGISLLCCGKILEFESDGENVRAIHESRLRDSLAALGVGRIITACPNCFAVLRRVLADEDATKHIEVVSLVKVLVDLGYRIDGEVAARMLAAEIPDGDGGAPRFAVHDSCPDRPYGEFADGLRAIMPEGMAVDPEHCRKRSFCCGSRPRAIGREDTANKMARRHGDEAVEAQAGAIVTPCISCTRLLSSAQDRVPVFHYLELLYDWRIPWPYTDPFMRFRFLFEAPEAESRRAFVGLAEGDDIQQRAEDGDMEDFAKES